MEKLLYFVEHFTLDPHLYYIIDGYEIQWLRELNRTTWRYRPIGGDGWLYVNSADVVAVLTRAGVDPIAFEGHLTQSVLYQAIFADLVLSKAREAVGVGMINAAIADSYRFSETLANAVRELTKPPLKLV